MTTHREVFSQLVRELTARLDEIAALRASKDTGTKLQLLEQSLDLFGARDWPALIATNNGEPITQWHVETGELMLDLATKTLQVLKGLAPSTPPAHA